MKHYIKYIIESLFDDNDVNFDSSEDIISDKLNVDIKEIKHKILNDILLDKYEKGYLNHAVGVITIKNYHKLVDFCRKCIFVQKIYNLNFINTRYITTLERFWQFVMFKMTEDVNKSIDISKWDVSNVTSMYEAFEGYDVFNSDLSNWNVSNVTNMSNMFTRCGNFNCDLSRWDVSNVTDMSYMFSSCKSLNCDLSRWNVSNVVSMDGMFSNCTNFNGDVTTWDVSTCTKFKFMFFKCVSFKQDLSSWKFRTGDAVNKMFHGTNYPTEILKMNKTVRARLYR